LGNLDERRRAVDLSCRVLFRRSAAPFVEGLPGTVKLRVIPFLLHQFLNLLQMYSDPLSQKMVPILFWVMTSYRSSSVIVALATASVKCNNGVFGVIIENALEVEAAIQARNFYLSTHVNVNDSHGSVSSGVRCGVGAFVHLR